MAAARMVFVLVLAVMVVCGGAAEENLTDKCSKEFPKVVACLSYATGKAATASSECCTAVTSIKDTDPACLCFVIQQVHDGSNPQVKSLGIQEGRLLQLPTVCKLTNANASNCPKLLNLPANSPDAAIFTNNGTADSAKTTTTAGSSPSTASPATAKGSSDGFKHAPKLAGAPLLASLILVLCFWALP